MGGNPYLDENWREPPAALWKSPGIARKTAYAQLLPIVLDVVVPQLTQDYPSTRKVIAEELREIIALLSTKQVKPDPLLCVIRLCIGMQKVPLSALPKDTGMDFPVHQLRVYRQTAYLIARSIIVALEVAGCLAGNLSMLTSDLAQEIHTSLLQDEGIVWVVSANMRAAGMVAVSQPALMDAITRDGGGWLG